MPRMVLPNYTIIRDTREKEGHGWMFAQHSSEHRPPRCFGTTTRTLETGDYSVVGYTDILAIERKANFAELWVNYSAQKRPAFEEEMERMSQIRHSYLIIESLLIPDVLNLSPPQFTKGVPGKSLIRWLISLSIKYGVKIIPAGSCGKQIAQMICEEVIRAEKDRWVSKDKTIEEALGF